MSKYVNQRDRITELLQENDFRAYKVTALILKELGHESNRNNALTNYVKKVASELSFARKELNNHGVSSSDCKMFWLKTKDGSYLVKPENELIDYDLLFEATCKRIRKESKNVPLLNIAEKDESKQALLISLADIHFGKRSHDGVNMTNEEFKVMLLYKVQKHLNKADKFNISNIILVCGNDSLHVDNKNKTTTAGTPQDTMLSWDQMYVEALDFYVRCIDMLTAIAPVHLMHNQSNHDVVSGFHLAKTVEAYFHNNRNITFDTSVFERKYMVYGASLIMTTHNDAAKESELPDLVKIEAKNAYAKTKYTYVIAHHKHHCISNIYAGKSKKKIETDYRDVKVVNVHKVVNMSDKVKVETVRSASPVHDTWHIRNGYAYTPNSVTSFIYDEFDGEIARLLF